MGAEGFVQREENDRSGAPYDNYSVDTLSDEDVEEPNDRGGGKFEEKQASAFRRC